MMDEIQRMQDHLLFLPVQQREKPYLKSGCKMLLVLA